MKIISSTGESLDIITYSDFNSLFLKNFTVIKNNLGYFYSSLFHNFIWDIKLT